MENRAMMFVVALAIFLFAILIYLGTRKSPTLAESCEYGYLADHIRTNNARFDALRYRFREPSRKGWGPHDRNPYIRARTEAALSAPYFPDADRDDDDLDGHYPGSRAQLRRDDKSFRDGGTVHVNRRYDANGALIAASAAQFSANAAIASSGG